MNKRNGLKWMLAGALLWGLPQSSFAESLGQEVSKTTEKYIGHKITNFSSGYMVSYMFNKEGIKLPSNLSQLLQEGNPLAKKNLQPGDVVFFGTSSNNLLAAGIYTGEDQAVVAYKPFKKIKRIHLEAGIGKKYYVGARRIVGGSEEKLAPSPLADKIISTGKKYLGTPYEFGSDRSNVRTFDCSDFVRQAYGEGGGIKLPSNSRTQAQYFKANGRITTDWRSLKPGDVLFFMSYKGPRKSDYQGIDVSKQRITHNGIYLGNGKILHTYSKHSGGVRIDSITDKHWEYRLVFGGSIL